MAEYTVELGRLIECGYTGVHDAFQRLSPSFGDSEWAQEVEDLFIDKYYLNEIGYETPDLFTRRMETAFKIILPYYRERRRINMMDLGIDPLSDYFEKTNIESQKDSRGNSSTTGTPTSTTKSTHETTSSDDTTGSPKTVSSSDRTLSGKDDTTGSPSSTSSGNKKTNGKNDTTGAPTTKTEENGTSKDGGSSTSMDTTTQFQFPISGGSADFVSDSYNPNYASSGQTNKNTSTNSNEGSTSNTINMTQKLDSHNVSENKDEFLETKTDTLDSHRVTANTDKYNETKTDTLDTHRKATGTDSSSETKTDTLDTKVQTINEDKTTESSTHTGNHTARFEVMARYREIIENLNAMLISERSIRKLFMGVM